MIYDVFKRIFDIFFGIIGTLVLVPLSLIVKIVYLFNKDYNSIFYVQKRVGKNGKVFNLFKFRTMVPNSDELLEKLLNDPVIKKEYLESYKIKEDPRLTKFGKVLRKTSLDEMPQFLNVLIGNMSLIGPRPVILQELKKYGKKQDLLLSVKPGITGNWACNGRCNNTYQERIALEMYYVWNRSIWLDIKIIFKTIIAVIKKTGAV